MVILRGFFSTATLKNVQGQCAHNIFFQQMPLLKKDITKREFAKPIFSPQYYVFLFLYTISW